MNRTKGITRSVKHSTFMDGNIGRAVDALRIFGSSSSECLLLCLVGPAGYAARRATARVGLPRGGAVGFALDASLVALPPLCVLLWPSCALSLLFSLLAVTGGLLLLFPRGDIPLLLPSAAQFISEHRANLLFGTSAAILAVDFSLFPARFAKTEREGASLMDLGCGSFVFVGGLVTREATGKPASFLAAVRSAVPLFVLGVSRLVAVRASGYAVPIGEYGRDWNFFFSLAAVRLMSALLPVPASWGWRGAVSAAVAAALLAQAPQHRDFNGGTLWLDSPRGPGWASQNREGLVSMVRHTTRVSCPHLIPSSCS